MASTPSSLYVLNKNNYYYRRILNIVKQQCFLLIQPKF